MEYLEFVFVFKPLDNQGREMIAAVLSQMGFDSFSDTKEGINAYIPSEQFDLDEMNELLEPLKSTFESLQYTTNTIPAQNWNATWEKNFEPIIIDNTCRIRAPFHEPSENYTYDIIIEPKMSFGTGHHATTALMVKLMLELDFKGKNVLDMGCGTGILGILASRKNASAVLGIDVDQWSFENTMENAQLNKVNNLQAVKGDALMLSGKTFDVVLANINRNILLNDMEAYINCLNKGDYLLLSGFYTYDLPLITEKATTHRMNYQKHLEQDNWVAVLFTKSE
ncbi:MAG: 50S ribosomal protein L11 methyltransferase [Bacteroidetes bacterium HGW-Bacteroidetes-4]|jgi:ribosomal protein L11 methyltransferase|nr:MAG: 50S ribosomal protein L11 methyltransferase [Bacteroidetes bacterium HGW-Bacteroidetes-4]